MRKFVTWLDTVDQSKPIFWLYGEPKCGKSMFAYHIFKRLHEERAVVSSFRFLGRTTQKTLGEAFIANLITDVGHYMGPSFMRALEEVAEISYIDHEGFLAQRALSQQLRDVFIPAFNGTPRPKPLLVMLDGLELCERVALINIFDAISTAIRRLPICFVISSTATPEINQVLGPTGPLGSYVVSAVVPSVPMRIVTQSDPRTPTSASFALQQAEITTPIESPT
ncbi:hypothetical protein FA15DRAFT_671135 [Coprinopsis marcescibilis]|uniref:Nephrocystin 3-like N-terminal domain-containing protein n=1 Tax=Coprinopsis marcescibilis TaxID=230819 RepID=A0A5C3KQZ7_COPMA|nr:hypothetical protein FA15DRAFT_671135 [Coprinopsis marcescibilis]